MTIKEIAALAGVSLSAVSRYLNGGSLSESKRQAIRSVIEETGYVPEVAAQALRTKTSDLIGIIAPKLDSESVSRLTAGAQSALAAEGYLSLIAVSHNDPEKERTYLSVLQRRAVAGVILMATEASDQLETAIRALPIPVVVTGQSLPRVPCVFHDDFGAARELTQLVLARGRRRPIYLGVTERDAAVGVARRQGVQAALREAGLAEDLPTAVCGFDTEGGMQGMQTLLASHPELDAVICATDRIALGAMQALRQAGRRIPADVSICGVGDSWASSHVTPHLTTAHFYYRTCGEIAARQLIDLICGRTPSAPALQTKLGYEICCRDSI